MTPGDESAFNFCSRDITEKTEGCSSVIRGIRLKLGLFGTLDCFALFFAFIVTIVFAEKLAMVGVHSCRMQTFAEEHCWSDSLHGGVYTTVNTKVSRWDFIQPGHQQESQEGPCLGQGGEASDEEGGTCNHEDTERHYSQRCYGRGLGVGVQAGELRGAEIAAAAAAAVAVAAGGGEK